MPACIVFVHDDPGFAEPAVAALRAAGYDVVAFHDSMAAIYALEHPQRVKLLITRVRFPSGMPNGVALACMARLKQPGIKVLFTSFPEVRHTPMASASSCPGRYRPTNCWGLSERC